MVIHRSDVVRIPSRQTRSSLRFNITPLIDVVFLLIIFFLVASHIARSQTQQPVDLPDAVRVEADQPATNQLTVTVSAAGSYTVGGVTVTLDQLEFQLESLAEGKSTPAEVRIRGDRTSTFQFVEPILLRCAALGIRDVKFAVRKTSE